MRLPLQNTLFIYASLGLNFLLNLAQLKILTATVSKGDVGLFFLAAGISLIICSLFMLGFPMVFSRYMPKFEAESRRDKGESLLWLNVVTFAIPSLLTLLVIWSVAPRLPDSPVIEILPAAFLSHVLLFFVSIASSYYAGLRAMHVTATLNTLPLGLHVGLLYAFRDRMTATLAFHLLTVAAIPTLVAALIAIRPRFRLDRGVRMEIRHFWRFAVLTSLLSPFVLYVDRVIIAGTLQLEVLALYMIARKIENAVSKVLTIPLYTIAPELSFQWDTCGQAGDMAILFRKFLRGYLALAAVLCILVALFGERIVVLLSTSAYVDAYPILLVLLLGVIVGSVYAPYTLLARSLGRMDLYFYADLTWIASYAAACPLLIGEAGAVGVAWSAVAASTATMVFVLFWVRPRVRC